MKNKGDNKILVNSTNFLQDNRKRQRSYCLLTYIIILNMVVNRKYN